MGDQATGLLSSWLREKRINAVLPHCVGRVFDCGCGVGRLASHFTPASYLGFDTDTESVQLAQQEYPSHTFVDRMPTESGFDTAVALAVIEHVGNAAEFLGALSERLGATGRVIVTTPHPRFEWIHTAGAAVGVFSTEADDEHEDLLDETTLGEAGHQAGIHLELYQRFLFGANQLAVYRKG